MLKAKNTRRENATQREGSQTLVSATISLDCKGRQFKGRRRPSIADVALMEGDGRLEGVDLVDLHR